MAVVPDPPLSVSWVSLEVVCMCTFPACIICMFSKNCNLRASGWFCCAPDLTHNHKLLKTNKQKKIDTETSKKGLFKAELGFIFPSLHIIDVHLLHTVPWQLSPSREFCNFRPSFCLTIVILSWHSAPSELLHRSAHLTSQINLSLGHVYLQAPAWRQFSKHWAAKHLATHFRQSG